MDRRLLDGPIATTLGRFALPLLTTNFLHALSGTLGAIWISHFVGAESLTAVVNANLFLYMVMGAVSGAGIASGVAIGQARGAGDMAAIKRVVGTSLTVVFALGLLMGGAGFAFAPSLIEMVRMPPEVRGDALAYLRMVCLGMPSVFCFMLMNMMMRGSGNARTPFRFTLVWILLGMVLSPLLLTGAFGFPKMGIAGVAMGSLIANATALTGMLIHAYRSHLPIALRGPDLRHLRPDLALAATLARHGAPMALEAIIVQGSYFVLLSMVNTYGAATAAGYSAAGQLWGYVQMPALAISASISAMAAINIGARRWARVERIALKGCALSACLTIAATLLVYALGDLPLKLFLPQGGEALATARHLNHIALWGFIAMSITASLSAIVRANAAMLAPTLIFAVTMWVLRVPFAMALQPVLGVDAIWWSFPMGTLASAVLALTYFRWGGWRSNQPIIAHDEVDDPATPPGERTG